MLIGCVVACGTGAASGLVKLAELALLGAVVAPAGGALAVAVLPGQGTSGPRFATSMTWAATALAVATAVVVGLHGPVLVSAGSSAGRPVVGLVANRLTVTLLIPVLGIGAIVQSYSMRYLRADGRRRIFFIGASVMLTSMGVVASSATAAGVVAGWVTAGVAFVAIVGYRPDLPGVVAARVRTRRALMIGDFALIGALGVILLRAGNVEIGSASALTRAAGELGSLRLVVALAVVVAALSRCAQGPAAGWLPGTVAAPTPVSALLHAGFVNGGGILLVRMGALSSDSAIAMGLAFSVAVVSAVGATAVMTRRADVKTRLAYSTKGQMGFMVAECAVGATGAAVIHLVGHAVYKATLFLGSGSGVARPGRVRGESDPGVGVIRSLVAAGGAVAAAGVVVLFAGSVDHRGAAVLSVFVAASAGLASWSWWTRAPRLVAAWTAALLVAATLYGLAATALVSWIQPSLPSVGSGALDPWLLGSVAAGGLALNLLVRLPRIGPRLAVVLIDLGSPLAGSELRAGPHTPRTWNLDARPGRVIGVPSISLGSSA